MQPSRHTIRLRGYDYSQNGWYFVTICTENRENLFGEIVDGEMVLNDVGKMIKNWWDKIPNKYPHVTLDKYQIMPNHIHGIIIIRSDYGRDNGSDNGRDNPAPTTLGRIIAYFKYESTKQINQYYARAREPRPNIVRAGILPPHSIKKIFQRNYYEHIIRNEEELHAIRKYIEDNPSMWEQDRNNLGKPLDKQ